MRLQDLIINQTRYAMDEAFRYAIAVPEAKLTWKPLDSGRSVLEMTRELAMCADWGYDALTGKGMEEEANSESVMEWDAWLTVEECKQAATIKLERFYALVSSYPDEKLTLTLELPYGPDGSMRTFSMAEMMNYPHWNAVYHQGQIAYIQTLYGDFRTH